MYLIVQQILALTVDSFSCHFCIILMVVFAAKNGSIDSLENLYV